MVKVSACCSPSSAFGDWPNSASSPNSAGSTLVGWARTRVGRVCRQRPPQCSWMTYKLAFLLWLWDWYWPASHFSWRFLCLLGLDEHCRYDSRMMSCRKMLSTGWSQGAWVFSFGSLDKLLIEQWSCRWFEIGYDIESFDRANYQSSCRYHSRNSWFPIPCDVEW